MNKFFIKLIKLLPIIYANTGVYYTFTMTFVEIAPNLIRETELAAYKELKKQPLHKPLTYVAFPYEYFAATYNPTNNTTIELQRKLSDVKLKYPGFTVCVPYHYLHLLVPLLRKIGITTIFTPGVPQGIGHIQDITIVPFPYYARNPTTPASKKDILYSFIGSESKSAIRKKIFSMPHPSNAVVIQRPGIQNCLTPECLKEYRDILSRSRFSLCPGGFQPNSIRLYESLSAGAIPLLISDRASLPALPKNLSWNNCIIQIKEKDIEKICSIITSITPEKENFLRANCLKAYALLSNKNLVRVIRDYYSSTT